MCRASFTGYSTRIQFAYNGYRIGSLIWLRSNQWTNLSIREWSTGTPPASSLNLCLHCRLAEECMRRSWSYPCMYSPYRNCTNPMIYHHSKCFFITREKNIIFLFINKSNWSLTPSNEKSHLLASSSPQQSSPPINALLSQIYLLTIRLTLHTYETLNRLWILD